MAPVEIRLLGHFSVRRGGEEVPPGAFGGRLARTLVRLLATRRGKFVPRDVLAEALWPGRLPSDPGANLKALVNRARRALGDPGLIVTGPGGYSFRPGEGCVIDAEVFLERVRMGRDRLSAGEAGSALRELRAALDLWAGEPLAEDTYEDWAQNFRASLQRVYLEALESGAEASLALRDPVQAVDLAQRAVVQEPLREAAHLLVARSLAASGDAAAALRALHTLRRRLVEELGLDPSPQAQELERRILRGETVGPAVRRRAAVAAPSPFEELAFVGRADELESVLRALVDPERPVVTVRGTAGMGKSRLLAEVATPSSVPVVFARAFGAERDEPWALGRTLLQEASGLDLEASRSIPQRTAQALADLVPELEDLRPAEAAPLDPESRRALALEGGVRLVGAVAAGGILLVIDDLQWADATSLRLVGLLVRRVPGLALVLAYRPEGVAVGDPVDSFLRDLPSLGRAVVSLALAPLSAADISKLVADEPLARTIAEETDRTPLAVSEVLRSLAGRRAVERNATGQWQGRTAEAVEWARKVARMGQRRAIQARAEREVPRRRQILALLALVGREAPARVLATATGAEEPRVLDDLDGLARAGLVRLGDGGWAVAHDVVAEVVTDGLQRPERGRLHALLARPLAAAGGDPADVARHLAGAGDRTAAADAFARAGRQSLERFAGPEAAERADAGLALAPDGELCSRLLETRAEGRAISGDLAGAREDLRAVLASRPPGPERSRVLSRLAELTSGAEDYERAGELAELALVEAGSDREARAEALAVSAILDFNLARLDRAEIRLGEALGLFRELGHARGIARVLDAQALVALFRGRLRECLDMQDEVARLYRDCGKLLAVGSPRVTVGWLLAWMGRAKEGLPHVEEALALERTLGQIEGEACCLWVRGELLAALGRLREAEADAEAALGLARRIGHREWEASALRALAYVAEAAGDLERAEAVLREAVEAAGDIPIARSLAAGRLASVLAERGEWNGAETFARLALEHGVLGWEFDGRLVKVEVAMARGEPGARAAAAEALAVAEGAGFRSRARVRVERRLEQLGGEERPVPAAHRERRTFMFTDIVRSTALVEALGDEAWGHLLRWHDEVLRSLFEAHGGEEVKQVGDGFFVAFKEPFRAIECAVAIQRALDRHRRDHGFAPAIRIGLHEAEATREEADYRGIAVHEAARIVALAQGGEILASRAVAGHAGPVPVSEPRTATLRGIADPVELVAIKWR